MRTEIKPIRYIWLVLAFLFAGCSPLTNAQTQNAVDTIEVVIKSDTGETLESDMVAIHKVSAEDGTYTVELEMGQPEAVAAVSSETIESVNTDETASMAGESNDTNMENGNDMMGNSMGNEMAPSNNMMPSMSSSVPLEIVDPTVPQIEMEIPVISNFPDDEPLQTPEIRAGLELLVTEADVALILGNLDGWHVGGWYDDEEERVGIEFFDQNWEWLGYGELRIENGEAVDILELYAPRELTPEEYQAGLAVVEPYVLQNQEVLSILGNPDAWERYSYYNRWDGLWSISFNRGLDVLEVLVGSWEGQYYIEGVFDPDALEAEEQMRFDQDLAVSLAYEAEGINDAVFANTDNWTTLSSPLGGSQYGVSFVAGEEELYFVLVDIETEEILDTVIPQTE